MKLQNALMMSVCLALVACANDDGSKKTNPNKIPGSLTLKMTPAEQLSEPEMKEFGDFMSSRSGLDPVEHLLIEADESSEDRQAREEELQKAPAAFQAFVTKAKEICTIRPPRSVDMTTGEGTDMVSTSTEEASVSGLDCPLSAQTSNRTTISLVSITSESPFQGLVRSTTSGETSFLVEASPELSPLMIIEKTMKTESSSLVEVKDLTTSYSRMTVTGLSNYADGAKIKMSGEIEVLQKTNASGETDSTKMVGNVNVWLNDKKYVISLDVTSSQGSEMTSRLYLNGKELSQDLRDLLSINL